MTARTLSLTEVADQLGLDPGESGTAGYQVVYKMVRARRLRAVRVGRALRVPAAELDRFLAEESAVAS